SLISPLIHYTTLFRSLTIPNFVTLSNLELINTYAALFLPFLANVFSIYILKEAFEAVPDEIYYAAKVDGCSDWRYLWTVMVPLRSEEHTSELQSRFDL